MPRAKKAANQTNNHEYMSNGITISPAIPASGDNITLMYDGLLAKNGASHIFAHIGFGNNWDNKLFVRMEKSTTGFETTIPVIESDTLNICFKDCADNWDNNSGKNYSFDISK